MDDQPPIISSFFLVANQGRGKKEKKKAA